MVSSIDFNGDGVRVITFLFHQVARKETQPYTNEKEKSNDWDADWESATTVDNGVWYTESFHTLDCGIYEKTIRRY